MIVYIILEIIGVLLLLNILLTLSLRKPNSQVELIELKGLLNLLNDSLKNTERDFKNEFVTNRSEGAQSSKDLREELSKQLNSFTQIFSDQLSNLTKSNDER